MFGTSKLVTVGQTLEHARDVNVPVRLYIGGEWVTGRVLHTDGHGVAIATEDGDTCVIRLDAVSCVRIPTPGTGRVEDVEQRVPSQPRNALGQADAGGSTTGRWAVRSSGRPPSRAPGRPPASPPERPPVSR